MAEAEDPFTPGILNRGSTGAVCVSAEVTDLGSGGGSADPGEVLRVQRGPAGENVLDWSAAIVAPGAEETWGLLLADREGDSPGPWSLLEPGRLEAISAVDCTAGGVPLRPDRATILDAADCPARDPHRP